MSFSHIGSYYVRERGEGWDPTRLDLSQPGTRKNKVVEIKMNFIINERKNFFRKKL